MRLHSLTVSAFGPFAGTETVDFDELNEAGLFLLTGPTGAGKSSLLDAVCFALYGQVPGARGVKTLKSQHAPPEAAPEVVLDFSVRERRFVVRRRPEWARPKKRGEGVLVEKSSASITETTASGDHFLSARAAEVGLLVTELMGMNAAQFVQVALLPQGEFQTFLRASSSERHAVLQHLFRTDRFARIEDWVTDHSRGLRERAGRDGSTVQRLLDTVADRLDAELPEDLTGEALPRATADDRVLPWVAERLAEADAELTGHRDADASARARVATLTARHEEALRRREHADRRAAALASLQALDASAEEAAGARSVLDAGERADRCRSLLNLLARADLAADAAVVRRRETLERLGDVLPPDLSADRLAEALDEAGTQETRLEMLLPRERAATAARRELADTRARLARASRERDEVARRAAAVPGDLDELTERLRAAADRSARSDALALSLEAARGRRRAALEHAAVTDELQALADLHRDARDRALTARERRQELAARRLAGMAAELAGRLADGHPCEVCGSVEHPRPATAADDAVSEADQLAADAAVGATGDSLAAAARALQDAEHRRAAAATAADGRSVEEAAAEVARLSEDLADAVRARDEHTLLSARLETVRAEQVRLADRQTELAGELAALTEAAAGLERTIAEVARELAAATGNDDGVPLGELVDRLRRHRSVLETARTVLAEAETAGRAAAALREEAGAAAREHGFPDLDTVSRALLTPPAATRLRSLLDERDLAAARAAAVLDELGPDAGEPEVDQELPVLLEDLATARADAADTARRCHLAEHRVEAVRSLLDRLRSAITGWAPLRDESLRADAMSKLVRGLGQDNQLQMRLSAYVLATRLDQVVAAANERLGRMRDQRYLLQRTDRVARKGSQAGLGLEVVDQWTGDARDPATLSGGETFVVSLSLALGLADVVTQEAGGTEIETLFVDEGFGTLDADTLDDVMDRLDGLRAGGRTVGVVSHVSELRNRIPTQVHVRKGRSGSSVDVTTLVG